MKYEVFISYKRDGGSEEAELVRSELIKRGINRNKIFMDTYCLGDGHFPDKLDVSLRDSENILVIITRRCLDGVSEESNWVREIRLAMSLDKRIVPIYFDDLRELDSSLLPESIKDLSKRNAVPYVHQYAKASFDYLCSLIGRPMKKAKKVIISSLIAASCLSLAFIGYSVICNSKALPDGSVYILDTSTSKCYHIKKDCTGLSNAKHRLKVVSLEEAEAMGKKPCKRCSKKGGN